MSSCLVKAKTKSSQRSSRLTRKKWSRYPIFRTPETGHRSTPRPGGAGSPRCGAPRAAVRRSWLQVEPMPPSRRTTIRTVTPSASSAQPMNRFPRKPWSAHTCRNRGNRSTIWLGRGPWWQVRDRDNGQRLVVRGPAQERVGVPASGVGVGTPGVDIGLTAVGEDLRTGCLTSSTRCDPVDATGGKAQGRQTRGLTALVGRFMVRPC